MANAAYIAFRDIGAGEAARQVTVRDGEEIIAVIDLSAAGELLGIEVLDAAVRLPESLRDHR